MSLLTNPEWRPSSANLVRAGSFASPMGVDDVCDVRRQYYIEGVFEVAGVILVLDEDGGDVKASFDGG